MLPLGGGMAFRLRGPMCRVLGSSLGPDAGTLARMFSPVPGPINFTAPIFYEWPAPVSVRPDDLSDLATKVENGLPFLEPIEPNQTEIRQSLTPYEFMLQYRALRVPLASSESREAPTYSVRLSTYFMNSSSDTNSIRGTLQAKGDALARVGYGKGSPSDYVAALQWALLNDKAGSQEELQEFCDSNLGIDCSGFVTNYLLATGKRTFKQNTAGRDPNWTNAASYYNVANAVNDPHTIRRGDLLVWMTGNSVKRSPGHVALVESYLQGGIEAPGYLRVVESTTAAKPNLLDSMYTVESIIEKGTEGAPVMMLKVRRHGKSGNRVAVMRA